MTEPTFTVEIHGESVLLRSTENRDVFTTLFADAGSIRRLGKFLADFEDPTPVADDPSDDDMEAYGEQAARIRHAARREGA